MRSRCPPNDNGFEVLQHDRPTTESPKSGRRMITNDEGTTPVIENDFFEEAYLDQEPRDAGLCFSQALGKVDRRSIGLSVGSQPFFWLAAFQRLPGLRCRDCSAADFPASQTLLAATAATVQKRRITLRLDLQSWKPAHIRA